MTCKKSKKQNIALPRPLVVDEESALRVAERGKNRWFLDFGLAMFGTIRLTIKASRSGSVEVCLGEKLTDSSVIDRKPPGCIRCRIMTLKLRKGTYTYQVEIPPDTRNTGPDAVLMPAGLFEVLPFRYAEITLKDCSGALLKAVRLAVHYPFDDSASAFSCSDDRLNRVWSLCKHSIKATSFCGIYVDGDRERIAYEADAYINQLSHYGVDREYELARRTFEHLLEHPTWPTEWVLHFVPMAWADYVYTGRTDLLERYYDELRERLLLPLARKDGLISTQTGLVVPDMLKRLNLKQPLRDIVDWPPGSFTQGGTGERDGFDMRPVNTVVNAFHWWSLTLFARISRALGRYDEARFYSRCAARSALAIRRKLFLPERGIFADGEGTEHAALHATAFPVAFGLMPPGSPDRSRAFIRSRGMACSVYGAQYLLEAVYRLGMDDYALELMTAEHDRGWLNMLRSGSTVTLEAWDWRYKNNLDWNHAWGAAPANIIPRFLAGVRPAEPGFARVLVAPRPGKLLSFDAQTPTIHGPVRVFLESAGRGRRKKLTINSPAPICVDLSGLTGKKVPVRSFMPGIRCFEINSSGACGKQRKV